MSAINITDLAGVVYSSGKVFDGLTTSRRDTENFLRSGSLTGIFSRADLALLEDLRDVAQFIIDHHDQPIDATYVRAVNAQITRRGALHPGQLRTEDQQIGVHTRHGRHTPPALTEDGLQQLIASLTCEDVTEHALDLFVELAKAQPFEDGNKRQHCSWRTVCSSVAAGCSSFPSTRTIRSSRTPSTICSPGRTSRANTTRSRICCANTASSTYLTE